MEGIFVIYKVFGEKLLGKRFLREITKLIENENLKFEMLRNSCLIWRIIYKSVSFRNFLLYKIISKVVANKLKKFVIKLLDRSKVPLWRAEIF